MRFRQKASYVYSPVNGECVSLSDVRDPVFSSRMLGDGVALVYEGDTIYSPCYGTVTMIATTKHAIGIAMANGAEILIHIGLETVTMGGRGFDTLVRVDQKIKPGQKLVVIERDLLHEFDLTTPLVVVNSQDFQFDPTAFGEVRVGGALFRLSAK